MIRPRLEKKEQNSFWMNTLKISRKGKINEIPRLNEGGHNKNNHHHNNSVNNWGLLKIKGHGTQS